MPEVKETSLWFGSAARPLFGRLTAPTSGTAIGGVLMSPPIGREARLARGALRRFAITLAASGYVSLRFDHYGTGDSFGSLDDEQFDQAWSEGIEHGVALLRSCGVQSVAAIGMRLGATILGLAASEHDLELSSVVLWDPCESGRTYLRELGVLEALRRTELHVESGGSLETSEYVFTDEATTLLRSLSLSSAATYTIAKRILVVTREDRSVPQRLRERLDSEGAEWTTSSEQGQLLDGELPNSKQPEMTMALIETWLKVPSLSPSPYHEPAEALEAVVTQARNAFAVKERCVELGPHRMFGVVSEPVGEVRGPLIVMVSGINEDHLGPSRLWVELARQWGGYGLRTLRFDLNELGESAWTPGREPRPFYVQSRLEDICEAITAMNLANDADTVFVGLCSGAQLGLEVALKLHSRGVCVFNPQVGERLIRLAYRVEGSPQRASTSMAKRMRAILARHQWMNQALLLAARMVMPSAYSLRLRSALVANGAEILLLVSSDDLFPFPRVPIIRSFDQRRMVSSPHCRVEIVPGFDHCMLNAVGRARAVVILDAFLHEKFAGLPTSTDAGPPAKDEQ
jgi:pimeloyl-ACP methyl ester carboxylesterase